MHAHTRPHSVLLIAKQMPFLTAKQTTSPLPAPAAEDSSLVSVNCSGRHPGRLFCHPAPAPETPPMCSTGLQMSSGNDSPLCPISGALGRPHSACGYLFLPGSDATMQSCANHWNKVSAASTLGPIAFSDTWPHFVELTNKSIHSNLAASSSSPEPPTAKPLYSPFLPLESHLPFSTLFFIQGQALLCPHLRSVPCSLWPHQSCPSLNSRGMAFHASPQADAHLAVLGKPPCPGSPSSQSDHARAVIDIL